MQRKHPPRKLALPLAVLLLIQSAVAPAQTPEILASGPDLVTANETTTLDRETQRLESRLLATVTNNGNSLVEPPLHLVVGFESVGAASLDGLQVSNASGGLGQPPYQTFFLDCSNKAGGDGLAPGESFEVEIRFSRPRTLAVRYDLQLAGFVNRPPDAIVGGPYRTTVGDPVVLDASQSTDPEGETLTFLWTLPDGATLTGPNVQSSFNEPGLQQVALAITDERGATTGALVEVVVLPPGEFALGRIRILDGLGHPLSEVEVAEEGPGGSRQFTLREGGFGSLGSIPGDYLWRFAKAGHLGVCRPATLLAGEVAVIPNPWMQRLSTSGIPLSVLNDTTITSPDDSLTLLFAGGAFTQASDAFLTVLHGQSLPGALPAGWSPLRSFHLALPQAPLQPGSLTASLPGEVPAGQQLILASFDEATCEWIAREILAPTNESVTGALPSFGTFSIVLADAPPTAPPAATTGAPLPAFPTAPQLAGLTALGTLDPPGAVANRVSSEVTTKASVDFTGQAALPSGTWFQADVREFYELSNGQSLVLPAFDQTYYAYRNFGADSKSVAAGFPVRPTLLFGPEELDVAKVEIDVLGRVNFEGGVVAPGGGILAAGPVTITLPPGAIDDPAAAGLRLLSPDSFATFAPSFQALSAFALDLGDLAPGTELGFAFGGPVAPNASFVLAQLVSTGNRSGLQPVLRLASDAAGTLASIEPASEPRLNGVRGPGTYLLLQAPAPLALLHGRTLDPGGSPLPGAAVTVISSPWLFLSDPTGAYALVAPEGDGTLLARQLTTGDAGTAAFTVAATLAPLAIDLTIGPAGPSVISTSPAPDTTDLPRISIISVIFSEAIDPATFGIDGVALVDANTSEIVPSSVSLAAGNSSASLLPTNPLAYETDYIIRVSDTLADPTGLPLEGERFFGFKTEAAPARTQGAQLVIYEPGATNIPQEVLDDLVGYRPGIDTSLVVCSGSQGVADPEVPVILVNEMTGSTATVLSKPDGSFSSFIEADEEDFIAAVFVNANGTRIQVPATRQLFDTGKIGLYRYGGILEAMSDGGPVQVIIEPDAIDNRTVFGVEVVPLVELLLLLDNTVPVGAKLLGGGVRIDMDGDPLREAAEVVFPVDPESLSGPNGESAEEGIYALCERLEVDGKVLFGVVDKMEYGEGKLTTASPPFPGVIGGLLGIPVQMIFGTKLNIVGKIVSGPPGGYSEAAILAGVSPSGTPLLRVPGAIVGVVENAFDTSGRLRPGGIVARANSEGFYTLLYSYNPTGNAGIGIIAQSFRFPGARGIAATGAPNFQLGVNPLMTLSAVIPVEGGSAGDSSPPVVTVSPPSAVLPVGASVEVDFFLRDNGSPPSFTATNIDFAHSQALIEGETLQSADVGFSIDANVQIGPNFRKVTITFFASKSALISFNTTSTDASGNQRDSVFRLRFGAPPTNSNTNPAPADDNDETPPAVVGSVPVSGTTFAGDRLVIQFSEPIKDTMIANPAAVTLDPPALTELELDSSQRILSVRILEPEPDTDYELRVPTWVVQDLNDNFMESDYVLTFSSPAFPPVQGANLGSARGATTHGAFAYVIDNVPSDEWLRVYRVGDTEDPAPVGQINVPNWPRTVTMIPNYSYYLSADPATGAPSGLRENRNLVAVTGGLIGGVIGPWIWIIDVTNPQAPERVASSLVTVDGASTVIDVRWNAPFLTLAINSFEFSGISLVNLQGLVVGSNGFRRPAYVPGIDLNGDGDFVDSGEKIPTPEVNTLFGNESFFPIRPSTSIIDYDRGADGSMIAALRIPQTGESRAQVLISGGQFIGDGSSPDGAVVAPAGYAIKRVLLDPAFPLRDATGVRAIPAMIVARTESGGLDQYVGVYDLTNPVTPQLVREIELSDGMDIGAIRALVPSTSGELTVATTRYIFVIDLHLLGREDAMLQEQSIVMQIDRGNSGRSFGASEFAFVTSTGVIINRPPRLSVVQIPSEAVIGATTLKAMPRTDIQRYLERASESPILLPFLPVSCEMTGQPPAAPFDPPNALLHHYVRMTASGHLGSTIKVAAESLLQSGHPQPPKGKLFPPVVLSDRVADLGGIADAQPDVNAIELVRLSDVASDPLFNEFVSSPFVLSLSKLTAAQANAVGNIPGRKVLLSGNYLRFSFDPDDASDVDLDPWESEISDKLLVAGLHRMYDGVPVEYLDSQNPSPVRGSPRLAGIDLQTGEYSTAETDLAITGRHQDLVLIRAYESRAQFSGPFGPGWDFNFNARIVRMPSSTPPDFKVPLLGLAGNECKEWTARDILFIDGVGNVHLFKEISAANGNEPDKPLYQTDPAVSALIGGEDRIQTYYQSPRGYFSVLYQLTDGSWVLIHPSAHRMHFLPSGRLDRMVGAFQASVLQLVYRNDGLLDRVEGDRGASLEFDYHFPFLSLRRQGFDPPEENRTLEGRIARIRCSPSSISALEVEYGYNALTGALETVTPSIGDPTVYGHNAADSTLIESIEIAGGSKIPKQTVAYDSDTGMALSTTVGPLVAVPSGAMVTLRERLDGGTSTVAVSGDLDAEYDLDDRGRVSGFANREFKFDEDDQPAKFEGTENGVEVTYDSSNTAHRFRGNLLQTERYAVGGSGLKFVTKTSYDGSAFNRISSVTDIEGDVRTFTYQGDPFGAITATESRGGALTQLLKYNEYGQLTDDTMTSAGSDFKRMTQFLGAGPDTDLESGEISIITEGIKRDQYGRLHQASTPANTTTTNYDGSQISGQTASNPDFPTVAFTHDPLGRIEEESTTISGASVTISKSFDPVHPGKPATTTWAETGIPDSNATYGYTAAGALQTMSVDGETTTYTLDDHERVTAEDGPGKEKSVTYDGNLVDTLTENGITTEFVHDDAGRVEMMRLRGTEHTYEYEDSGEGIGERYKGKTIRDSDGTVLLEEGYTYDSAGRLETIDSLSSRKRTFTRFPDGSIKTMDIGGTVLTEIGRDDKGRLTSSRANQVRIDYGAWDTVTGTPQSETMTVLNGAAVLTTSKVYDDRGRLMSSALPAGTWMLQYDGWGNLLSKTDPDGVIVSWERSPSGYLLGATFFDGTSVTYNYNPQRRIDTISSSNGSIEYGYDSEGLTDSIVYPDGSTQGFKMRNAFLEATEVSHGALTQTYGYDNNGRVDTISCPTGDVLHFDFDGLGRRTKAGLNNNLVTLGYQSDGALVSETYSFAFLNLPQSYSQSLSTLNHLQFETYPSGLVVDFGPDPFGDATTASATGVNSIDWFAPGAPQNIFFGNTVRIIRDYDPSLRLTRIRYLMGSSVSAPLAAGFAYELTAAGRIKHEEELHTGEFDVFSRNNPDEGMRVTGVTFGAEDKNGNNPVATLSGFSFVESELRSPTSMSTANPASGDVRGFHATIDFNNGLRPVTINGSTVTYDSLGAMESFPVWVRLPGQSDLAQINATAAYDGFGNIRQLDRSDGVSVLYTRDGFGRIIRRQVTGPPENVTPSDTAYVWADNRLLEEYTNDGAGFQLIRRYVYLAGELLTIQKADTPGGALTNYIPVLNRSGSVCGYLDLAGNLLERIDYSAYGMPIFRPGSDDALLATSSIGNTLLFQGGFFDEAVGLYFLGERTLHPLTGLFLQRDGDLFTQNLALFTAFNGDPAGMADPTGLQAIDASKADASIKGTYAAAKEAAKSSRDAFFTANNSGYKRGEKLTAGLGAASKGIKLANKFTDEPIIADETVDAVTGTIDQIKAGVGIVNKFSEMRASRDLLSAVQSVQNGFAPAKAGRLGWLNGFGASATSGLPSAVSSQTSGNKWYRGALITRASGQGAIDAHAEHVRKDFLKNRKAALLDIGSGLSTLSKAVREKYYKGSDYPSVLTNQGLASAEKVFDAVKSGSEALEWLSTQAIKRDFNNPKKIGLVNSLAKKPRSAISAAWTAGFETGKFIAVALSDPETAKEYNKLVTQFEKDGGFLTVFSGVLSTIGMDDTAHAIQQYQDYNLMDDLARPINNFVEGLQKEQSRQAQYLRGISAP